MNKSSILLMIFTFLIGLSTLINAQDDSRVKEKSFTVKKGGKLYVRLDGGNVKITTWDKNEVNIKIKSDDIDEITGISTTLDGNTVSITNRNKSKWGWSEDIIVYASIPSEFNTEINTQSGDISQKGNLKGSAIIYTAGGDIRIDNVTGETVLKSQGGEITTGDIGNNLTLSTNGGDVKTGAVSGKTIINTMGGSIRVTKSAKDLDVNTMGGDISIGDIDGNAEVKTMGGDISVNKVSGNARINTYGGEISLSGANGLVEATTFGGNIRMTNISGSVKLDTKSGDIYLELNPSGKGKSKIKTMNGGIKIVLPSNAKANVSAKLKLRGSWKHYSDEDYGITSDFKAQTLDKKGDDGTINAVYQLNGGGEDIEIYAINGSIEIKKK